MNLAHARRMNIFIIALKIRRYIATCTPQFRIHFNNELFNRQMISLFDIILHELTRLLSRIQYGGQFTVEPLFTILQLWILHAKNNQWNKVLNNSWIILLIIDKSQMSSISGCHVLSRNCLPFRSTWVHPRFLVGVARSLVFCIIFCRSLSDLFFLAIILSVLRITASSYLFKEWIS